jgi:two-component system, cell cycle sensor histidine kinase and response regulator CckA
MAGLLAMIGTRRLQDLGLRTVLVLLLLAWTGTCPLAGPANAQSEPGRNPPPRVLILDSYHQGEAWSDNELAGIRQTFSEEAPEAELLVERLDAKRHSKLEHLSLFKEILREKYGHGDHQPNLVMVLDNPALDFLVNIRRELFPGIPVVFAGINNFTPELLQGQEGITGVAEVQDMACTVALALSLHPNIRRILAVHDHTTSGLAVKRDMMAAMEHSEGRVQIDFTPEITMESLRATLRNLPEDSVAMILSFVTDSQGKTFSRKESTELITSASPVPVYAMHETRMGFGILGGYLLSGEEHGRQAAELALRVLNGENPASIPVVQSRSRLLFDFRVLQRFGISESRLPEGSTVLFKSVTLYQRYQWWIWGTLAIFAIESALIFRLVVQRRRSRVAEASLRESETKFRELSESITEVFWIGSTDYRHVHYISPAYEVLWGRPASELLQDGLAWVKSILDEDRESILSTIPDDGFDWSSELRFPDYRIRRPDGSIRWISARAHPIRMPDGSVSAIAGIAEDITERKQAEVAIFHSEKRLKSLVQNLPAGAAILENGRLAFNRAVEEMIGYSNSEIATLDEWFSTLYGDREQEIRGYYEQDGAENLKVTRLVALKAKDGKERWVEFNGYRDEQAEIWVMVDRTQNKVAEDALRQSEARLRLILENSSDIVWTMNAEGLFTYLSPALLKVLGYDPVEWVDRHPEAFAHPDDLSSLQEGIQRLVEDRKDVDRVDLRVLHADGSWRWISTNASPVLDPRGNFRSAVGVSRDVSVQRRLEDDRLKFERQLMQTRKMESLGRMAGAVAHHFNNLLAAAVGNLEIALDDLMEGRRNVATEIVEAIKAGRRATKLTRMLTYYLGHSTEGTQVLDLSAFCQEAMPHLLVSLPDRLEVRTDLEESGLFVEAAPDQMRQILVNLFTNAWEAIGEGGGEVRVSVRLVGAEELSDWQFLPVDWQPTDPNYVCLSVSDTGCGIPPSERDNLFDPFFTTKFTGRGLGLPVVLGGVLAMGGAVSFESEEGAGSVFRVLIPLAPWPNESREETVPGESIA